MTTLTLTCFYCQEPIEEINDEAARWVHIKTFDNACSETSMDVAEPWPGTYTTPAVPIFDPPDDDGSVYVECSAKDCELWGYASPDVSAAWDAWKDHAEGLHPLKTGEES